MDTSGPPLPDWPRVHGEPVCSAVLRSRPSDFQVVEELGFAAAGDGEHDLLHIEKTGTNTEWLARQLARHAGVPTVDVGYAGLKDRDAVTSQYFTVRRPNRDGTDWSALVLDGVRILEIERHNRKLRRGAHTGNRFRIAIRGSGLLEKASLISARWQQLTLVGVPNYFGSQRFGRNGSNLDLARSVLAGKRVKRDKRSFAISAARSFLFNEILAARIGAGSWDRLLAGELANLDGSGSVFAITDPTPELRERCAAQDIHPTGCLWGDGAPLSTGAAAALETAALVSWPDLTDGLLRARVAADSRALRVVPRDTGLELGPSDAAEDDADPADKMDVVWLSFRLPRGAYATAVLRELINGP
jgi:tRNA pseudouridine13 synthase